MKAGAFLFYSSFYATRRTGPTAFAVLLRKLRRIKGYGASRRMSKIGNLFRP